MAYLSCKWLHIVSVISWMAGVLYLFRLFVYHAEGGWREKATHELLSLMERRLYRYITFPAMIAAWLAGAGMVALNPALATTGWLQAKFLCVLALSASTLYGGRLARLFGAGLDPYPSGKKLRFLNEVPTLLMFIIVAMVVFRPW